MTLHVLNKVFKLVSKGQVFSYHTEIALKYVDMVLNDQDNDFTFSN